MGERGTNGYESEERTYRRNLVKRFARVRFLEKAE